MKAVTVKKMYGQKALVINDINSCDLAKEYKFACNNNMLFFVNAGSRMQMWGTFHVADYLQIGDSSKLFDYINS